MTEQQARDGDTTATVVEAASHGGLFGFAAAFIAAAVAWTVMRKRRRA